MASEKLRKIAQIKKEITVSVSQTRYDIAGLTLGLCKFFYRTSQNLFQDLAPGDYTIDSSNNSQILVIQNTELLKTMEAIQVCYIVDLTSSRYETDFNVDTNQLKDNYNKLVDDVHILWNYIKTVGMIADDTSIPLILPQLNTDEVWVKTADGYKGISLTDAEGTIKKVIGAYTEEMKKVLDAYVEDPLKPRLDKYVEDVNKPELDNHVTTVNKPELDRYTTELEKRLQIMIDQAVADKGLMPPDKDWYEVEFGNWLVTDLFNKNYTHYPPQLGTLDKDGVLKKDIVDGGRTQVIRFYTTTGKMLFIVRANGVWSEWQELGEQTDAMQFTQAGHGFIFTAVTLDGVTRKWTKATKYTGADGIAIRIDDDRFDVVIRGVVAIPSTARDDKGNAYVYDEYYFLSQDVDGGLARDKALTGTFQNLIRVSELDGKQVAYVDVQSPINLDYEVLDSDTADMIGIGTYKTTMRTADTIEDLKRLNLKSGEVIEVLGYYTKGDGANHKRIVADSDDGSGIQIDNGKWVNIIHNGEVNVSWLGAKGNGTDDDGIYFQKAFDMEKVLIVFYDKDYWIKSTVDVTDKNKTLKGLGQKRQVDKESGKTLYMNGGKFVNLFKILGVNAVGVDKATDVFCEQPYCYMRYVENCDFESFLNVFIFKKWAGMLNMRNVSFIGVRNACIKFDYGTTLNMCTTSNFENVIVYTSKHFIDGDYAELVTFTFKNIVFEDMLGTPIKASIVTQCSFENIWLEKGDSEDNKYMIITRAPQLIYASTFNNIRRHGLWEVCNLNTGGGIHFPRKEDTDQLFQFRNNNGYATNIGGGIVEKPKSYTSYDNKLSLRAGKYSGYGNGTVEVGVQGGQFVITGYTDSINRQDMIKIQKSDYDILLESKNQTVSFVINDKIFNIPQVIVFDKNSSINSTENGLCTVTEISEGIIEIDFGEQWRYPAISVTVNSNEDFYVHKMYFIESYLGGWKAYGDAKAVRITFQTIDGTLKTPERILFQIHKEMRGYKKSVLQTLEENFSEQLMKDENVYDDYIAYKTDTIAYDKQVRAEEEAKQKAYEQALLSTPDLSYEDFLKSYPMAIPVVQEPTIPKSVQDFMKKYL